MPDPDPDPGPPTPRSSPPRAVPLEWVRNGAVWLVLIASIVFLVVETVISAHPHGWMQMARGAPRVVVNALLHAGLAFVIAVLLHALLRRSALWIALAVVLVALYPLTSSWRDSGHPPTPVWMWIPFGVLLGLAAMHAIPRALHEAAAMDRAGRWFAFRTITLPLAAPLLVASCVFLVAIAIHPVPARKLIVAHVALGLALVADAILGRRRR